MSLDYCEIIPTKDNGYAVIIEKNGDLFIKKEQTTYLSEDYVASSDLVSLKFNAEGKIENIIEDEAYVTDTEDGFYTLGENIKKYNSDNEIIWQIPNKYDYYDVHIDQNGEIILESGAEEEIVFNEDETSNGEKIEKTNNGYQDITLIKINDAGKVDWVNSIGSRWSDYIDDFTVLDNGIVLLTYFNDSGLIPASETAEELDEINLVSGQYIIKYNLNGKIESVLNVDGQYMDDDTTLLEKDGFIKSGWVEEETIIPASNTVDGNEIELQESQGTTLIKFDYNGKVQWIKQYDFECEIFRIDEETNGLYIYNDYDWDLNINISGEYTANGESIELSLKEWEGGDFRVDENWKITTVMLEDEYMMNGCYTKDNGYVAVKYIDDNLIIEKYKKVLKQEEIIQLKEITIKNEVEDSFRLVKQNESKTKFLAGAKFVIKEIVTNENGSTQKVEARDIEGNVVGIIENINGTEQRVVTTDENGEIREKLKQGKYEIQEIQAPDGYEIDGNNNTYEFEITVEQAAEYSWKEVWSKLFAKTVIDYPEEKSILEEGRSIQSKAVQQKVNSVKDIGDIYEVENGGFIATGIGYGNLIIPAEDTVGNKEIRLTDMRGQPYIIKYNSNNKVEWVIKSYDIDYIETNLDGSFKIDAYFYSQETIPGELTASGEDIEIGENSGSKWYIIKYNAQGKIETVEKEVDDYNYDVISASVTENGEKVEAVYVEQEKIIAGEETKSGVEIQLDKGYYLIKYNSENKVEWTTLIGSNIYKYGTEVKIFNSGSIILKTEFSENTIVSPEQTINNEEINFTRYEDYIIKYNNINGKVEGFNYYNGYYGEVEIIELDEGTFISQGYNGRSVIPAEDTADGKEINLDHGNCITKYNEKLKIEKCVIIQEGCTMLSVNNGINVVIGGGNYYLEDFRQKTVIPAEDTADGKEIIIPEYTAYMVKFNNDLMVENVKLLGDIREYTFNIIANKESDGYMIRCKFDTNYEIPEEDTIDGQSIGIEGNQAVVIKYDINGKVEWVAETSAYPMLAIKASDGSYVVESLGTNINNKERPRPMETREYSDSRESYDVYYARYAKTMDKQERLSTYELPVTNKEIERQITTEVKGEGGTISGWENKETPYEILIYGQDARKEIKIQPNKGYKVARIYVNDEEIPFEVNEDGTVNLEKFINVTEDKHVVVEFERIESKVIIQYLEKGTENKIADDEEIVGYVDDEYEVEEKEIQNYRIDKETYPQNTKGLIGENEITVKYYYERKVFNLKVEKWIDYVELNGEVKIPRDEQKNKLAKVEINRKQINESNIKIHYKIEVSNDGELVGKVGKIIDYIPEGLVLENEGKNQWRQEGNIAIEESLKDTEIKPGESKELDIVMSWQKGNNNFGTKRNSVEISEISNMANFEEKTIEDNKSQAEIIISIQTGIEKTITIGLIIALSVIAGMCYYKAKKRS